MRISRLNKSMNKYKLLLIIIGASFLLGCSSAQKSEKYYDLLYTQDKYAAKSVTIDDYTIKEEC